MGSNVTIHCKSKDDDLGIHVLQTNQSFEWSFKNNIWGTTRFYCYLNCNLGNTSFDVYRQGMCGGHCFWFVRPVGICLQVQNMRRYRSCCYKWPPRPSLHANGWEEELESRDIAKEYDDILPDC
uniref:S-protein homolog n=1 Tax=Davidia involucrata TaxID=16924 RepID=A0A5B7BUF0_DAVIN